MKKIIVLALSAAFLVGVFSVAKPASAITLEEIQSQLQFLLEQVKQLQVQNQTANVIDSISWCYDFKTNLRRTDTGKAVANLHVALKRQGYAIDIGEINNQRFGDSTKRAVIAFQEKYKDEILTPLGETTGTGIVANTTRAKLNQLYGCSAATTASATTTSTTQTATPTNTNTTTTTTTNTTTSTPTAAPSTSSETTTPIQTATTPTAVTQTIPTATTTPSITVVSPNGGEKWGKGLSRDIQYSSFNTMGKKMRILLVDKNDDNSGIWRNTWSINDYIIADFTGEKDGGGISSYSWKVGDARQISGGASPVPGSYRIKICSFPDAGNVGPSDITCDTSAAPFNIVEKGSGLNQAQIEAVISLLQSFGANQSIIEKVSFILKGGEILDEIGAPSGLSETQIDTILQLLRSFGASQSMMDQVKNILIGKTSWCYDFNKNLKKGDKGKDISALHIALEKEGFAISQKEKNNQHFINSTGAAVIAFQEKYKDEILKPVNERRGTGFVGKTTRVKLNQLYGCKKITGLDVQKSDVVPPQNIAIGMYNQPLGGFSVEATGEPIAVGKIIFRMSITDNDGGGEVKGIDIYNIALFDENGYVVAGPVGATGSDLVATVALTDTVVFPVGTHTYVLKGNLSNNFENNDTIIASTIPSTDWTGWPNPIGQITNKPITPSPSSAVYANTMTAKSGALAISVSSVPVAQTILAGARAIFANYNFDTTASSEDVRFPSIPLKLENTNNAYSGAPNNLTSCQLYDGSTALNTGTNSVDPIGSATSTDIIPTFNFDTPLIVPKGIVKTLGLQCKVSTASPAGSQYQWGIAASPSITVTGVTSGADIAETVTASDGQIMTVTRSGTLTVSLDPSSPPYKIAAAGTSGVTLGKLKFHAASEAINLSRFALQLTNTASSSIPDLTGISIWDGSTQVGTAAFTSTRFTTSILTTTVTVPKDGDKVLTIKGDLAQVGTSQPGTQGALIAVDYDGDDLTGTRGVGQQSGSTINSSSRSDTKSAGVRMFKSFPTFAKLPIPTNKIYGWESGKSLYRFSVKADSAGSIGIYKFTTYIATTSAPASRGATTSVINLRLKAYTDQYFSQPVSGFGEAGAPAGQLNNTIANLINGGTTTILMNASTQGPGADFLQIPAGATYYFDLIGDIAQTNSPTSAAIQARIEGDDKYPHFKGTDQMASIGSNGLSVAPYSGDLSDFIWSPNATTSSLTTHKDWTNGYFVPGLPPTHMDPQTLTQ